LSTREEILDHWVALSLAEYFGQGAPENLADRILRTAREGHDARPPAELPGPTAKKAKPKGVPSVPPSLPYLEQDAQTAGPHRGLRLVMAAAVVAAAAAAVLVLLNPPETSRPKDTPPPAENAPVEQPWRELMTVMHDANADVDTGPYEATVTRGGLTVELKEGEIYTVHAAGCTVELTGPAKAYVRLAPLRSANPVVVSAQANLGDELRKVSVVSLVVRLKAGHATLRQGDETQELVGPQEVQRTLHAKTGKEDWAKPASLDDAFADLDANHDGSLDATEISAALIGKLDGDSDGSVSRAEFDGISKVRAVDVPQVIPFSRMFHEMDRNGDGKLDPSEVGSELVAVADTDKSGDLSLEEAEAVLQGPSGGRVITGGPFDYFDGNGDGKLDADEVSPALIKSLDADASGDIDRAEFRRYSPNESPQPLTPEQQFKRSDFNGDGKLSSDEIAQPMIEFGDTDGDGQLSLEEFKKLTASMIPQKD